MSHIIANGKHWEDSSTLNTQLTPERASKSLACDSTAADKPKSSSTAGRSSDKMRRTVCTVSSSVWLIRFVLSLSVWKPPSAAPSVSPRSIPATSIFMAVRHRPNWSCSSRAMRSASSSRACCNRAANARNCSSDRLNASPNACFQDVYGPIARIAVNNLLTFNHQPLGVAFAVHQFPFPLTYPAQHFVHVTLPFRKHGLSHDKKPILIRGS